MYQSVDIDTPDKSSDIGAAKSATNKLGRSPNAQVFKTSISLCVIIAAALFLFALVFNYKNGPQSVAIESNDSQASRAAYLKAIAEPRAALRRARLQDFLQSYNSSPRKAAAHAQLDLLGAYEVRDWNYITRIAYEDSLSHTERLNALEAYGQRWGGNLLGGRTQDIEDLRVKILGLPDNTPRPDRRLVPGKSPIPSTVPGDKLAGEPNRFTQFARPRAVMPAPPRVTPRPRQNIVPPKARRNVTPRYPRKALRKNIGALVVLNLSIDANGRVQLTELVEVQAQNYQKDFIKAAERAALRTRFNPQTVNGNAVPVSGIQKRYRFQP